MFDGRRDWTLTAIETNDKLLKSKEIEEHIPIVAGPGSCYIDQVGPEKVVILQRKYYQSSRRPIQLILLQR